MRSIYNAFPFEITGVAKGVFTHSQSSCHIAKVVLTIRHDSRQIPIASDARPFHTSRGFLHWRFAYAGPHRARRTTFMGPASANLHKNGLRGNVRFWRSGHSLKHPRQLSAGSSKDLNAVLVETQLGWHQWRQV